MACLHPIAVGPDGQKAMVRCGKCMPCRVRRKQSWVGRMVLERIDHVAARFITLTYADPAKQKAELEYEDFQRFLKRYRYYYGPMRFFACGEYGEKSGNAHWHAIIFGHAQEAQGFWETPAWKEGFCYDGSVTLKSIGYVASYATKATPRGRSNLTERSLRPGIGLGRIEKLAEMTVSSLRGSRLGSWPGRVSVFGRRYPLMEGGLVAFQRAFLEAGGLAPPTLNPDDRHTVTMEALADLGSRLQASQVYKSNFDVERGRYGLKVPSRERV